MPFKVGGARSNPRGLHMALLRRYPTFQVAFMRLQNKNVGAIKQGDIRLFLAVRKPKFQNLKYYAKASF